MATNLIDPIPALAAYMTHDLGGMSIRLQMKDPAAVKWAAAWSALGLMGYPDQIEAQAQIRSRLRKAL